MGFTSFTLFLFFGFLQPIVIRLSRLMMKAICALIPVSVPTHSTVLFGNISNLMYVEKYYETLKVG